jgi:transcriptional regulator with XRE-family HTH domain
MADEKGLDLVQLGQTIRSLRTGKGWSLAQLAEKSGVSKAYLSDLENGSAGKPNIQYVYSVATALAVTLDDLLGESKPKAHRREKRHEKELPSGLLELRDEMELTDEDIEMLAYVNFRGHRPRDKDGWRFLLQTLRMVSQRSGQK